MGLFKPKWHPANWDELSKEEQGALRDEHRGERRAKRRTFWRKVWAAVDPLIKQAIKELPDNVGDDRREWVVDQVQLAADKIATAPGVVGAFLEKATDAFIYSDYFESLVDDKVQEAYDRLKAAGDLG